MAVGFSGYSDDSFGGSPMDVQASSDQGATWTTVATVPSLTGSWQSMVVDLGAYDGMSSVMVGWTFTDNGSWSAGAGVDNVCVAEILEYNMTMVEAFHADVLGTPGDPSVQSLEYTFLALEQAISTMVGGAVRNNGGMDMTNVILDCEIFLDGTSQGVFSSTPVAVMIPGQQDTILFDSGWTPSTEGDVDFTITVRADSADMGPADNAKTKSQFVSDDNTYQILGRDGNSAQSFAANAGLEYSYGPDFIISTDAQVYGILVAIGSGEGALIQGHLLDANLDEIDLTDDYEIKAADENLVAGNTMTYLPFSSPVDVFAQEYYVATVEHFGGAIDVTIANSGVAPPFTTTYIDEAGGLFYTASIPMIRLVMAENPLGIDDYEFVDGIRLGANMPNPFGDNTVIPYELKENAKVDFRVVDINGKVVFENFEGNKPAGSYLIEFDGSELANGLYTYTIVAGNSSISKRMIVTH